MTPLVSKAPGPYFPLMERIRRAVESRDFEAVGATLSPDVVFQSPVVYKPYVGRELVVRLLRTAGTVFQDFRYVADLSGDDHTALVFRARVGDRELEGIDLLQANPEGLVRHLTVFVRPMSAARALADAMAAKLGG
jgi:hypothetical protein